MAEWEVIVPPQGIEIVGKENIKNFLNDEIAYYRQLRLENALLAFANAGYGTFNLSTKAISALGQILADVDADKTESLQEYVHDAIERRILIGASAAGRRVAELQAQAPNIAAKLAAVLSQKWTQFNHPSGQDLIGLFQALLYANPAAFGFDNLITASHVAQRTEKMLEASEDAAGRLEVLIKEKTDLISTLEDLYRKKLTIQEPAISWENIAARKVRIWRFWLFVFAMLIAAPITFGLVYWETIASAVKEINSASQSRFLITGLAVVTVPALLYAWLLKNISRIFLRNLNLADDADHRRSLALTYMGLVQDEKRPTTDQDRAIILNALFRPIPPHTGDGGPPAGLVDLIRKP